MISHITDQSKFLAVREEGLQSEKMDSPVLVWPLEEAVSRAGWRGWVKRIDKIPDVFGNLKGEKTFGFFWIISYRSPCQS